LSKPREKVRSAEEKLEKAIAGRAEQRRERKQKGKQLKKSIAAGPSAASVVDDSVPCESVPTLPSDVPPDIPEYATG
jgi:hypothetical protein